MQKLKSRRIVTPLLVGATLVAIFGYSAYAAYPFVRGPRITIDTPQEVGGIVTIHGHTTRVSAVTVAGLPVPLDERGNFTVERAYPPGYTVIVVRAVDRFGRSRERTITFVTAPYDAQKTETGSSTRE